MAGKIAFKMELLPGCAEEYKKRHDEVWPEITSLLKDSGVSDYTIFLDEETNVLFAVQRVAAGSGSQDLASCPAVQRWWAYMKDLMKTHEDNSPISTPLRQVFHMD